MYQVTKECDREVDMRIGLIVVDVKINDTVQNHVPDPEHGDIETIAVIIHVVVKMSQEKFISHC